MLEVLQRIAEVSEIATFVYSVSPGLAHSAAAARDRIKELLPRLSPRQQAIALAPGNAQVIALLIIDQGLLDDFTKRIQEEIERYRQAAQSGNKGELDAATDKAEKEICTYLRRIKDRNDDELPDGDWTRWWRSYKCVNFA